MATREFRGQASLDAERITREAVAPFLRERGFVEVEDRRTVTGSAQSQTITARTPSGQAVKMRVRLCWRRDGRNARERTYAAAQLRARLIDADWEGTLRFIVSRDEEQGNTHTLIVQQDGIEIVYAAMIPRDQLLPIWIRQRDISAKLIANGAMRRISKNHAMNGASPTLWLQDARTPAAHAVPDALWGWPGVEDVAKWPVIWVAGTATDDTFDDCPSVDYSELGRDGASRTNVVRSEVKRDAKVRLAVLERSGGKCERETCGVARTYKGFLDVHHILGVEKSDRTWNCVALCPNCHREAHFAPDADDINRSLLARVEMAAHRGH